MNFGFELLAISPGRHHLDLRQDGVKFKKRVPVSANVVAAHNGCAATRSGLT